MFNYFILSQALTHVEQSIQLAYNNRNFAPSFDERQIYERQLKQLINKKKEIETKLNQLKF